MRLTRLFLSCGLLALAAVAAAVPTSAQTEASIDKRPLIVGGEPTTIERHPWQIALIQILNNGDEWFVCGGSIVHNQWILTAAHCVAEYVDGRTVQSNKERLRVGVGSTDHRRGRRLEIEQIVVHEAYDRRQHPHDIAMLKLREPIDGRPVELAPESIILAEGDMLELTGWGSIQLDAGGDAPPILQRIDLPYISFETCNRPREEGGQQGRITDLMLCVRATRGHGQCAGDSGGPLVRHTPSGPVQVGVVSFSSRPCTTQFGVFTRVSSYRDWIARVMAFH